MDDKPSKNTLNEKVIKDLTRNLNETFLTDDSESTMTKSAKQKEAFFEVESEEDPWDKIEGRNKKSNMSENAEEKSDLSSDDFVDEEALKDREVDLSEEEKEKLRNEAEKLKNEGNNLFKLLEFKQAVITYTQAIQTCPLAFDDDRAILYANRAAAKSKYAEKNSAIEDCSKAIELNPLYLKAITRRAQLYEQDDKLDEALADFQKILELDTRNSEANYAIRRLPPKIQERNEKLKNEMMGKLKDLGNMILKPFGLSTNNFQMEQDPSTGGYSVKFNQNGS